MSGDDRTRLRAALAASTETLGRAGVPSPSVDARALIVAAARHEGPLVLLDDLPADFEERLEQLVSRRASREPLQIILGRAPFRRLELTVRPGVFVPRPETELAVDLMTQELSGVPSRVVDLCTGSGALAAAVLDEMPRATATAVDVDPAAVALATENIDAAGPGRGRVLQLDLSVDVDDPAAAALRELAGAETVDGAGGVDAVLSNPPYVPPGAVPREPEVRDHDPERALYGGGADGLALPAHVLRWAHAMLRPGGVLVMEHADVQGPAARELAARHGGFTAIRTAQDLTGRDRFLVAHRCSQAGK